VQTQQVGHSAELRLHEQGRHPKRHDIHPNLTTRLFGKSSFPPRLTWMVWGRWLQANFMACVHSLGEIFDWQKKNKSEAWTTWQRVKYVHRKY